jgi:hypothetical protein
VPICRPHKFLKTIDKKNKEKGGNQFPALFIWTRFLDNPMMNQVNSKIKSKPLISMALKPKLFAIVLLLCFGVLAGFSPLLHNHDLDFSQKHEDCASCLWSQSKISCEFHAPSLSFNQIIQTFCFESSQAFSETGLFLISSRSPPFSL